MTTKKTLMLICVAVIVIGFFLPWVTVESEMVGGVTKILTGKKQSKIAAVSAFKVPIMANSEESRFMIGVIKIFQPKITDADKKSWLIWAVPLLAILLFWLDQKYGKKGWVRLIIAIIGCGIFFGVLLKISQTDLNKALLKVHISYGLWMTLIGYFGIGMIAVFSFYKKLIK